MDLTDHSLMKLTDLRERYSATGLSSLGAAPRRCQKFLFT